MSYLYGDSTPSPLEVNFIEFLRDGLDFSVQVLLATERIQKNSERSGALRRAALAETDRLEKLGSIVTAAIDGLPAGDADGPTSRCSAAIIKSAGEIVRAETAQVNQALGTELARIEAQSARERETCVRALEQLLLRHDLPETALSLSLTAQSGTRYVGRLRATTAFGVIAMLEIDVPQSHLFGHVVRVDRILERLEIQAPDAGGWLHKEVKMRPQRLEKLHITELQVGTAESLVKLRGTPEGQGAGFDIAVRAQSPRIRMTRVGENQESGPAFDVSPADAAKILGFYEKLEGQAVELTRSRKALIDVSLDNHPVKDHENPAVLVERLIAAMAPVVSEIAWRSRSATELILKRLLADDRREEIFVAKAELLRKLDPLPAQVRKMFDVLGLHPETEEKIEKFPRPRRPPTLPPQARVPEPMPAAPVRPISVAPASVVTSEKVAAAGGEIKLSPPARDKEETEDTARLAALTDEDSVDPTIRRG